MLRVENLQISIGTTPLLRGLDLALHAGERLGIVGESGSGKSLTALAIMGLLPPAMQVSGRVLFNGEDLLTLDDAAMSGLRGRAMAMVFQEPASALNPAHRIGDQIAEGMILHRIFGPEAARQEARHLLERVGIADAQRRLDAYPHELSGGQRQRVMIAMALACRPAVLIADEPTSALDVSVQKEIITLIETLCESEGMALLVISHDVRIIARLTSRMMVMYGGALMEEGATKTVLDAPRHPYTRGLMAALPSQVKKGERLHPIPGTVPPARLLAPGCPFHGRCALGDETCRSTRPMVQPGTTRAACFHLEGAA